MIDFANLYFYPFFISCVLCLILLPLIRWVAFKFGDWQPKRDRDLHKKAIPRWGGAAIILSFLIVVFLNTHLVIEKSLRGIIIAVVLILIFGLLDDLYEFSAKWQFFFQLLVILIVIFFGIHIDYITNPWGAIKNFFGLGSGGSEMIRLDYFKLSIAGFQLSVLGCLLIAFWLFLMMNAINWFDGIDGLACGISLFGFLVLFILSISALVNQPPLGIFSIIMVGILLAFWIFNFPRKKGAYIFLGTSGSLFLGFMLGILSIFSGGKMGTAAFVLIVPILDALWVVWQRWRHGMSIFAGDKNHLHHRLLNLGFSQRQIVFIFCSLSFLFGFVALFLKTVGKMFLFLISIPIIYICFVYIDKVSKNNSVEKYLDR